MIDGQISVRNHSRRGLLRSIGIYSLPLKQKRNSYKENSLLCLPATFFSCEVMTRFWEKWLWNAARGELQKQEKYLAISCVVDRDDLIRHLGACRQRV
jgi:hypothetical protein